MKRSLVVNKIYHVLNHTPNCTLAERAEIILRELETLGMLPPERTVEKSTHYPGCWDYDTVINAENVWDEE